REANGPLLGGDWAGSGAPTRETVEPAGFTHASYDMPVSSQALSGSTMSASVLKREELRVASPDWNAC
ncbi:MAG TPA: hypothetical protein VHM25_13570, partial [Polyangiaceae bacterium]|nr:hypothetical protein [Polyangiaceae bacterium]